MNSQFEVFGLEHFLPMVFVATAAYFWFEWSTDQSYDVQRTSSFILSLILPALIIFDTLQGLYDGSYDATEDLPLHMCRLAAFIMPFMFYFKNRWLFGILYFWILAGTLQAILTPDLASGFPTYEYLRYWILHLGLVALILFPVVVYRFRPKLRDFWNALWTAQVYLLITVPLNYWLGSNYGYTMRKPPGASIADLMGPWPWYILVGEVIMLLLFFLLLLPFLRKASPI